MPDSSVTGIYLIRCRTTNKVYVGRAKNIPARWRRHRWELREGRHANAYLQAAWQKYGEDQFEFSVLNLCPVGELQEQEVAHVQRLGAADRARGYNLETTQGGVLVHAPETRVRISLANRGKRRSLETRQRMSRAQRGKIVSVETRARLRVCGALGKGIPKSVEHKQRIAEALRGREVSSETCARISASKQGRPVVQQPGSIAALTRIHENRRGQSLSEATRIKIGQANRGRVQSPEERARRSAALKGRPKTAEQIRAAVAGKRLRWEGQAHGRA